MVKEVNMSKSYIESVEKILKEVEHILMGEASMSLGVKMEIEMGVDIVPRISYEIKGKVVI